MKQAGKETGMRLEPLHARIEAVGKKQKPREGHGGKDQGGDRARGGLTVLKQQRSS